MVLAPDDRALVGAGAMLAATLETLLYVGGRGCEIDEANAEIIELLYGGCNP